MAELSILNCLAATVCVTEWWLKLLHKHCCVTCLAADFVISLWELGSTRRNWKKRVSVSPSSLLKSIWSLLFSLLCVIFSLAIPSICLKTLVVQPVSPTISLFLFLSAPVSAAAAWLIKPDQYRPSERNKNSPEYIYIRHCVRISLCWIYIWIFLDQRFISHIAIRWQWKFPWRSHQPPEVSGLLLGEKIQWF